MLSEHEACEPSLQSGTHVPQACPGQLDPNEEMGLREAGDRTSPGLEKDWHVKDTVVAG